ncbi:ift-139 [Pristionchus pacificus]|nr:ift-139 [Pristionchus pacificus]
MERRNNCECRCDLSPPHFISIHLFENRLRNAMINNPRATVDPGYNYCKGIHEWYSGNMNNALQCFNRARKDLEWGEKAIYNIVEVLLNPENDIVGVSNNEDDSEESTNSTTAARFLGELRADNAPDSKYALHTTMIMMASGEKQKVQEALEKFLMMALEKDPGGDKVRNVGAVLGAARAYVALKLVPKAKQLLKRVMDFPWTLTDAEHLEMLATTR